MIVLCGDGILETAILTNSLTFSGLKNTTELFDTVKNIVDFVDIKINSVQGTPERFQANFVIGLFNQNDVDNFVMNYSQKNNETLKVATTRYVKLLYFINEKIKK